MIDAKYKIIGFCFITKNDADAVQDERRKRIKAGIAESGMEGNPPPGPEERAIDDAYIRGDIDARGRTNAILRMLREPVCEER